MTDVNAHNPKKYVKINHPEWSKNATIYEVNIRQYTPEGTFQSFQKHLPRLKDLGVDILWLMPIHPIGDKNRKGKLGSYYAVKDYYAVNPEFGTLADLKALVKKAHSMGMHVILDWVGNHSAWDHPLTETNPDWYSKTKNGDFQPTPWFDWDDIIDFDYNQPALREYMNEALQYWVKETDIDGFRCDVAGFVPIDFWEHARSELNKIKPVFMLAEWESRDLHKKAFDMTYHWTLYDRLLDVAKGKHGLGPLLEHIAFHVNTFPKNGFRMNFIDNHDKNSWEGDPFSNFGEAIEAAIVLTCTMEGMPLIYSGQEAGLNRSLKFFEKDTIEWKHHPLFDLYKKLFQLKHTNRALWNGMYGGQMERIPSDSPDEVISFARQMENHTVLSIVNYSTQSLKVTFDSSLIKGKFKNLFSDEWITISDQFSLELNAWDYLVLYSGSQIISTE